MRGIFRFFHTCIFSHFPDFVEGASALTRAEESAILSDSRSLTMEVDMKSEAPRSLPGDTDWANDPLIGGIHAEIAWLLHQGEFQAAHDRITSFHQALCWTFLPEAPNPAIRTRIIMLLLKMTRFVPDRLGDAFAAIRRVYGGVPLTFAGVIADILVELMFYRGIADKSSWTQRVFIDNERRHRITGER
jgi:hypothetical protein